MWSFEDQILWKSLSVYKEKVEGYDLLTSKNFILIIFKNLTKKFEYFYSF